MPLDSALDTWQTYGRAELFGATAVNPAWLAWNGGTVRKLAQAIHEQSRFTDLPILADALEEAGCTAPALLAHARGGGPHKDRCWLIDALLDVPEV
jgi:hypothetical protein